MLCAISKLDSFIQRCVDAMAFSVMRVTVVRKSSLRYSLLLGYAAYGMAVAALSHEAIGVIGPLIIAGSAVFALEQEKFRDKSAMRNSDLAPRASRFLKSFLVISVLLHLFIWSEQLPMDLVLLAWVYLGDTKGTPPPTKKRTVLSAAPELG